MRKNPKEKKHPRIRRRVFAYLAAFVAFVLALLWLMQIVWLDDFYRWDKTRQITQAADAVESNIGNAQLSALMDRLAQQNDVCILLLDSDKHVFLSSDDIHYCLIHRMSSRDLSFWCSMIPENGDTLTELFNIAPFGGDQYNSHQFRGNVPKMEDDKKQSLLCARRVTLPDGTGGYLLLNSIITPLDSTVATLRTLLMLITIIVLLGATLLAMLISRKVTRSIVETSEAAHSLSRGQYEIPPHGCEYREMAELNGTLVYAAKELSQVENLQHELIANISHDLRTPLTMIGGYVEMMRDIPGEATPENMQVIIDETQRLTSLVNELLDFSRLQTGALALNPAPYPFTASVQAITDRVSHMVQQNVHPERGGRAAHLLRVPRVVGHAPILRRRLRRRLRVVEDVRPQERERRDHQLRGLEIHERGSRQHHRRSEVKENPDGHRTDRHARAEEQRHVPHGQSQGCGRRRQTTPRETQGARNGCRKHRDRHRRRHQQPVQPQQQVTNERKPSWPRNSST